MYLLPKEHSATRKIQDGLSKRCDIYSEEPFELSPDDFMRFIESHLNKVKRINSTKRVTKVMRIFIECDILLRYH